MVLSVFFQRLTIDGTLYASGIFEGKIKKELGLKTYQIVTVGCFEVTVCSYAGYQAKLTERIHPRFVALAGSMVSIVGCWIGAAANEFWLLLMGKIVLRGGLSLMYFPATLGPEAFLGTGRTMTRAFIG